MPKKNIIKANSLYGKPIQTYDKKVIQIIELYIERKGLLAENQAGAVRRMQRGKKQAMLNLASIS